MPSHTLTPEQVAVYHDQGYFVVKGSLQSNLAYNETSTSWKTPVDVVPDEAILNWEAASLSHADFLKKENDPALRQ